MSTDDLHKLTGPYVLDALDPDDQDAFERHLGTCESCTNEVAELASTVAEIGIGEQIDPPSSLKGDVLAAIQQTSQQPPATVTHLHQRRNRIWSGLAVAAALVVAFSLGNAWNPTPPAEETALAESAVAQEVHMLEVATAADVTSMPMASEQGQQSLVYSADMGEGILVVQGTQAPPADDIYQIWLTDSNGVPQPVASFRPNANGAAAVMLAGDLADAKSVTVTMESGTGAKQPSLPVVASADMA